jgi:hypothetical protein
MINYPLVKGIQVCSHKVPGFLQRGDNHKNVKMGWGHLKVVFFRTTRPSLTRLGTNHHLGMGIQIALNEKDSPSSREDNCLRVKMH